jgi:hypothetical protein
VHRFGGLARELLDFCVSARPRKVARQRFDLLRQTRVERMGRLNPWRSAFLEEAARPRAVFGPVLARAFARLARIFRSLVTPRFFSFLVSSRLL